MTKRRVLVACEFSGVVRQAMRWAGHDAYSCDLYQPAEDGSPWHLRGDAARIAREHHWDLMIGARWFKGREREQAEAIAFVEELWDAPIARIAIENPIGVLSTRSKLGKPTQIIQPWQFGHGETKATCLWLKGLPPLEPTNIVDGRQPRVHREPPGPDRWNRSRTYTGIAAAMAEQWSRFMSSQECAA